MDTIDNVLPRLSRVREVIEWMGECPLLAQSRHRLLHGTSAFGPKRTTKWGEDGSAGISSGRWMPVRGGALSATRLWRSI